jgi:1-deoxy-D-xylulose-5-phosphate synthase
LHTAFGQNHPFALHYPRDAGFDLPDVPPTPIPVGQAEVMREGRDILIIGFGPIVMRGAEVADALTAEGWSVGLVNARFAKPLDEKTILDQARGKKLVVTLEEGVATGGVGAAVLETLADAALADESLRAIPVKVIGLPRDHFVDHGAVSDLRRYLRIDVPGITEQVHEALTELELAAPVAEPVAAPPRRTPKAKTA